MIYKHVFDLLKGTYQVLSIRVSVDLFFMGMKGDLNSPNIQK